MPVRSRWKTLALRLLAALVAAWLVVGLALFVRFRRDVRELQASWITTEWGEPYSLGDTYWPCPPRWQHLGGVGIARRHLGPGDEESVSATAMVCAADDPEQLPGRYQRFLVEQGFSVRRPRPDRPTLEAERPGATASVRIGPATWMGYRELTLSARGRLRDLRRTRALAVVRHGAVLRVLAPLAAPGRGLAPARRLARAVRPAARRSLSAQPRGPVPPG